MTASAFTADKVSLPSNPYPLLISTTADIVAAYVSRQAVSIGELPTLISTVYGALAGAGVVVTPVPSSADLTPAVPIKKSITADYIICLEDGKKLKSLKRHLRTSFNMTPDQYRAKWNLPAEYPMVAPIYSQKRSDLAKSIGLGRKVSA